MFTWPLHLNLVLPQLPSEMIYTTVLQYEHCHSSSEGRVFFYILLCNNESEILLPDRLRPAERAESILM
jgi:hypothetical protein